MKKLIAILSLCFTSFVTQAVPVEQPNVAWGQPLPSYCMVTFDSSNFSVAVSQRPDVPAPKGSHSCASAWALNAVTFWKWFDKR